MLTPEDIQKLSAVVATKEDIRELREDINGLREMVQTLVVSVDRLVAAVDKLNTEYAAIINQVDRHERWIQQLAEKLGVKLEY